jgi:hypothetical protein
MKKFLIICLYLLSVAVHAELYKCTNADGSVGFSDKPCQAAKQETIRLHSGPAARAAEPDDGSSFEKVASATGRKVTGSSPLGNVYMSFVSATKRCDRAGMAQLSSAATANEIMATSEAEFREACQMLQLLLNPDLHNATEIINGNRATITWKDEEITYDGNERTRFSAEQTVDFIKESGQWKFGG